MKIAISTLPFREWEVDDVIASLVEGKYDAIEIRMDFHPWSDKSLPDSHYEEIAKKLKKAGLKVTDLGSSVSRVDGYRTDYIEDMKRLFKIANILDATGIRIMLGHGRKFASEPIKEVDVEGLNKWLLEVDEMAEKAGVQAWIESHAGYSTGAKIHTVFKDLPQLKNIKVIWDFQHSIEHGETIDESIDYMFDQIVHIHIKDGEPWNDPEQLHYKCTALGAGVMPIAEIVKKVQDRGYDGYYSLEWESAWKEEVRELNCDAETIRTFRSFMEQFDTKK
ncbi:MAG: sugar phosphate isomerase/epimerase [Clostridia bacterium]